jgi:hypothetical protein
MPFCPQCGSEVQPGTAFCPRCGRNLSSSSMTAPSWAPPPPSPMSGSGVVGQQRSRPDGVAVLAILAGLGGLALFGSAAILVIFVPFSAPISTAIMFGGFFAGLVIFLVVLGFIEFVVAFGYWMGYPWAWWVGLILSIIGLIGFPIGTIINAIIIYYLTRPHVKAWFRQEHSL